MRFQSKNTFVSRLFVPFALATLAAAIHWGTPIAHAEEWIDPSQSAVFNAEGWEELSDGNGIKTWGKQVPGSSIVAFRGEGILDAPIAKAAQMLADTNRKAEWIHKCAEAKNIKTFSELDRIEYNRTLAPVIMKDRDFVYHAKVWLDMPKHQVRVLFKSIETPEVPEYSHAVRGKLMESRYTLTSIDEGKRTRAMVEVHADPAGAIPKWIVNLFQKSWPRNTLLGMQQQLMKPDVQEMALVKEFFEGKIKDAPYVMSPEWLGAHPIVR